MKRIWILMLALCVTALFCVSTLGLGAEEADTEIWSVYSSHEDASGVPHFGTPPTYAYTPEGLRVTPLDKMESYTVQTDRAYSVDDGLYMEIKLDEPVKTGILIFHLWDQNGLVVNNFHCGSGWQGMVQLEQTSSQFMISVTIQGAKSLKEDGTANILGSMRMATPTADDGSVTYALSIKDGVMRINGSVVVGTEEALKLLKESRPDGSVYVGVSVILNQSLGGHPLTVTRFGTSRETASVPGSNADLPQTGETSSGTPAPEPTVTEPTVTEPAVTQPVVTEPTVTQPTVTEPTVTEPTTDVGTEGPVPETRPGGDSETNPGEPGQTCGPEEVTTVYDPYGDPPDMTTEKYDPPFAEKGTETRREIKDDAVDNFMAKLETGCASALGVGGIGLLSVLAAAYVCARKKK